MVYSDDEIMMRRGSLFDVLVIMVLLLAFTMIALTLQMVNVRVTTALNSTFHAGSYNTTASDQILTSSVQASNTFTGTIPFVVFCMGLLVFVLAFQIPSNPIFLPFALLALAIYIVLATIFSNVLWAFLNDSALIALANGQPLLVNLVRYLPVIVGVLGFGTILAMNAKPRSVQGL